MINNFKQSKEEIFNLIYINGIGHLANIKVDKN